MMLDRVQPGRLHDTMRELAARGDSLAGLVSGEWGQQYLTARGVDKPQDVHRGIVAAAIAAAKNSTDENRAAAAEALDRLRYADAAVTSGHQAVRCVTSTDLANVRATISDE
jgi:poly-gamma-glutamate capsule biosynthesis protein CapA/YwtB (metallophosphatase superfamily)